MDYPKIIIKHKKEDIVRYNLFSMIERSHFRRIMQYVTVVFGLIFLFYFAISMNIIFMLLGAFCVTFPYLIKRTFTSASKTQYERNDIGSIEVTLTFKETEFHTQVEDVEQVIPYDDIYRIYNFETELFIYLNKNSGLYINKTYYDEATMNQIITSLQQAIPDMF